MTQPGGGATPPTNTGARLPRILTVVALAILLIAALVGVDIVVLSRNNPAQAFGPHYYMALGDSLSFGYQPNLDFSAGFADDLFNDLHKANVTAIVNYACAGESTTSMINGGCPGRFAHHGSYTGPQLQAAVNFLKSENNYGRVSPITLEIGSNDVLKDWDATACSIAAGADVDADLATMDANLTKVILPQLLDALGARANANNGDLHLLNYYNPYAKDCPGSAPFVHELNDHLAADAAQFRIPVVNVYDAFGGDRDAAGHICEYTWMWSQFHDVHPTDKGYWVIARAVETALALPGGNPLPGIAAPRSDVAGPVASLWRRPAGWDV